jgi:hypothetical protein
VRLIGRDHELASVADYLQRRTPGVIVIEGGAGLGRHALVAAACEQTPPWSLVPDRGSRLYVEPRTTIEGFTRRLCAALGDPRAIGPAGSGHAGSPSDVTLATHALQRIAPVVVVLDRYRPRRPVDRWFADTLLPRLQADDVAVMLAVLDPPARPSRLLDAADLRLEIGELPAGAVRSELERALVDARPPVTPAELERYVSTVARRPRVLAPLVRLLTLR